jgi:hypothetical protein
MCRTIAPRQPTPTLLAIPHRRTKTQPREYALFREETSDHDAPHDTALSSIQKKIVRVDQAESLLITFVAEWGVRATLVIFSGI